MLSLQLGQPSHQEPAEGLRGRDANDALDTIVAARNPPLDSGDSPLGLLGERHDLGPRVGQHEAVRRAREQAHTESGLQCFDTSANRRVPHMEAARGCGKTAGPADGQEVAKVVPIEAVHSCTHRARA
jgi:hypothetical protein